MMLTIVAVDGGMVGSIRGITDAIKMINDLRRSFPHKHYQAWKMNLQDCVLDSRKDPMTLTDTIPNANP